METAEMMRVPGARLYYEVRGSGPVLLISQSGEGDAGRSRDMVDHLAAAYTVVTYDRRGLSRSTLDDPAAGATVADHAGDVRRLLAEVADEPAFMLGCSFGAVLGLHLAIEHPEVLHMLIAHEPVAPRLLPGGLRVRQERELLELRDLYRREGLTATFAEVARVLGIDPVAQETEPDITRHPMDDRRKANFAFFVENDFAAVVEDTLEAGELAGSPVRIIPAVGRATPRTVFDHRCAVELAALLGVDAQEFPGGHNGNLTHPRAYAARVHDLLGG
ncbi:alpha/beta hydrolase [Planotetraspora phitsanulokensis]|uniref:Putative hydrolase YraK n=1 Tax=Planotetraspora phitsanulokensis TaxID=575192 RepID=A0A8J3XFE4_9ACTN|nr:alpha/beta hydrolase [Planotetraspora phitsanulokensis]GII38121.1 putative hydrolase YraK [Planotetraspora phitsanulokensis]